MKKYLLSTLAILLLLGLAACKSTQATPGGFPGGTPPAGMPATQAVTEAATATVEPTEAPTAVATEEPIATVTPVELTVISTQYCRVSPDLSAVGVISYEGGKTIQAVGRDSTLDFYYIQDANVEGGYCWIWDNYVMVNGEYANLPIIDTSSN